MKKLNLLYLSALMSGALTLGACDDDENVPGNPVMDIKTETASACFGDSLAFTVNASDADVPLSTLKAQLYFGEEMVSETVIRTKVSGEDYTGKIYVPFYKDVPNGTATLRYVLQNIHFTITEQTVNVQCTRPQWDHLLLVAEDGTQYTMPRTGENQYAVTASFPQKLNAYILAPAYGTAGNEMTFGYGTDGAITEGSTTDIPFSNLEAGEYTVTFNTLTYEAGPFLSVNMNGQEFVQVDLTFVPISGNYRITADMEKQYFKVEVLDGAMSDATLQSDGTGALWIVGGSGSLGTEAIGKPSYVGAPSWDGGNGAICMSPIEPTTYQITLVAGRQITADGVNFKFYGGKNWANEYQGDRMSTDSDLFVVNSGSNDNGNVWLAEGVTLEEGATYVITVDMSDPAHAVMHAVKK